MVTRLCQIERCGAYVDWEEYVKSISARFSTHAYDDPLAELRNLRQEGSLQGYLDAFDDLYLKAGIYESQPLSFFLSGL